MQTEMANNISTAEVTVALKLNQTYFPIPPEAGRFRVAFLVTFFPQKK